MNVSTVPTAIAKLDASRRRAEALDHLRLLLRQSMAACQAAAFGMDNPERFLALGQVHAGLADLLRALPEDSQ